MARTSTVVKRIESLQDLMHDSLARDVVQLPLVLDQKVMQGVVRPLEHNAPVPLERLRSTLMGAAFHTQTIRAVASVWLHFRLEINNRLCVIPPPLLLRLRLGFRLKHVLNLETG